MNQIWRGVFEKRAPLSLRRVEELIAPNAKVGQGSLIHKWSPEILEALSDAYREGSEDYFPCRARLEAYLQRSLGGRG